MSSTVIKVENISKLYRLGEVGTGTLRHDLNRWWHKVRGKEDPYAKIGQTNDRTVTGDSEYVWALKDINFEVKQGEVLGIIGRNGAGKSTLLKILSRVTMPTSGEIKVKGRIASLLEVGTGFNPELTGRDNIYLNGAILGMRKREIDRKLDEIVDFSGVERYIDTPVKRYSSGMYVRLAFAVAAHLEPEILIVDEVLAVGDAEFQKKCMGKMESVSRNEGRTVLFVSHNMAAVKSLCASGVRLSSGELVQSGGIQELVDAYLLGSVADTMSSVDTANVVRPSWCGDALRITSIRINEDLPVRHSEALRVTICFTCLREVFDVSFGVGFSTTAGVRVLSFDSDFQNRRIRSITPGLWLCTARIPRLDLQPATYALDVGSRSGNEYPLDYLSSVARVEVLPGASTPTYVMRPEGGVRMESNWELASPC